MGAAPVDVETLFLFLKKMECDHVHRIVQPSALTGSSLESINWICSECQSKDSPWVCLSCGIVRCGRYVNSHAKQHADIHTDHCLCMDQSLQLYCYAHDDYVINDTEIVRQIRKNIQRSIRNGNDDEMQLPLNKHAKTEEKNENKNTGDSHRTTGLCNLGNTCFMNAVIQPLSNLDMFSEYMIKYFIIQSPSSQSSVSGRRHPYNTRNNVDDTEKICVVHETAKLFKCLWNADTSRAVSPDSFLSEVWKMVPRFRGYQQQDAHEFLIYLLNQLNVEESHGSSVSGSSSKAVVGPSKASIIKRLFGGLLQSDVNCLSCHKHSRKIDPIYDVSLDIPRLDSGANRPCTVYDCLTSYTSMEELSEPNWYHCQFCGNKQPSTKKLSFKTLPQVLCIHLKRFKSNQHSRSKINSLVTFPVDGLNMSQFSYQNNSKHSVESTYKLASFVMHHGSGVSCGHYTACIHSNSTGEWYHYNDSTVNEVNEEWVKKSKAYILFYVKPKR